MKCDKIFNSKLYVEGLRQTLTIGILLTVIVALLNSVTAVDRYVYVMEQLEIYEARGIDEAGRAGLYQIFYFKNINSIMNYFCVIVSFFMAYCQFKFLNSRKACDFYHALPVKRISLVVNFSLASFTTLILATVIPVLVNTYIYGMSKYNIIDYKFLLPCILDYLLVSFLIFSAVLLGMSLTENFLSASAIALIVLILPRYTITKAILSKNIATDLLLGDNQTLTDVFSNYNNLFYKRLTQYYDNKALPLELTDSRALTLPAQELDYTMFSYFYTFILALLIFAIACFVFVKRKSEIATSPVANTLGNHIIRVLLVLPCSVMLISNLFIYNNEDSNTIAFSLIMAIFLIYFTYELIITQDVKKMIRVAPVFLIVILFNLGYYGLIQSGISIGMKNSQIEESDIKSISFKITNHDLMSMYDTYTAKLLEDYEITNPRVIELVSNSLNAALNNNAINNNNIGVTTIKTKSTIIDREISRVFSYDTMALNEIVAILNEDEYIKNEILTTLPKQKDLYISRATSFGPSYDVDTTQIIADTLYKEYEALTNEQKLDVVYCGNSDNLMIDMSSNEQSPNNVQHMSTLSLISELQYNKYVIGGYKERTLYDYDYNKNEIVYKEFPSYNSNDLPVILALYTAQGDGKYIKINENLPNTKKLLVDLFMEDYRDYYKDFVYVIDDGRSYFGIVSLDDSYTIFSEPTQNPDEIFNGYTVKYDSEFLDLVRSAIENSNDLDNLDYDNLYFVNFYSKSKGNIKLLLPFTQQEYEKYLLNIQDYITLTVLDVELPLLP